MRERRHGSGFALKPPMHLSIPSKVAGQHFYGDITIKACIVGSIHLSHAARTEPAGDLVVPQARA
jgi:hypothetical protein